MLNINPVLKTDFYKQSHRKQYPEGTEVVVSNLTARGTRVEGLKSVIHFGTQASIMMLHDDFQYNFFEKPKEEVVKSFKRILDASLGGDTEVEHIEALHDLGYLPLEFTALPEGASVPLRVPMVQFWNTKPEFYWLTNFIETEFSANTWGFITSATTANIYRGIFEYYANETCPDEIGSCKFQGHDFSYRGMFGSQSAMMSGMAHLTSFCGTDTIPAIVGMEYYYNADCEKEMVGASVPASEHSCMCAGGDMNEYDTFKRMITEVHPTGIVSIVSDTWDFWQVVNPDGGIIARLKDIIMKRDGKTVVRPDSGDPVHIICGYDGNDRKQMPRSEWDKLTELEKKGMIQCLYEIFGGTENEQGYKILDEHIGAIYGDSITIARAEEILYRLKQKGFASCNIVLGIGSFTYQGAVSPDCIVTRDTHGMAIKATYVEINGEGRAIFKNPKTDDGLKKSAKGLIVVYKDENGEYYAKDESSWEEVNSKDNELKTVYVEGEFTNLTTLDDVRENIRKNERRTRNPKS